MILLIETANPFCSCELFSFMAVKHKIWAEQDAPIINKAMWRFQPLKMPDNISPKERKPINDNIIRIFFLVLKYSEPPLMNGPLMAKPIHNKEVKEAACGKDKL